MPRTSSQKMKILRVAEILYTLSDQEHPITVAEILTELDKLGIHAERKSVYDDLDALRTVGMDIIQVRGRSSGYYLGSRRFELAELKLLCDCVQSSQFITKKKTANLLRKLENFASVYEAGDLSRQIYQTGRVKTTNESVLYNVDELSRAIDRNCVVRFQYREYTISKQQKLRHNGRVYELSPYALIWDRDRYYLLAWDEKSAAFKHFRVDRMVNVILLPQERLGREEFAKLDLSRYSRMIFGMFSGEEKLVTMRFHSSLVNAVVDHFGREPTFVPDGEEHFTITVPVMISPQFFAWLFSFGEKAEILSPADVRQAMAARIREAGALYE